MLEKAQRVLQELVEIDNQLTNPDVLSDIKKLTALNKKRAELFDVSELCKMYVETHKNVEDAKVIVTEVSDDEMVAYAKTEIDQGLELLKNYEEKLRFMLVPPDPYDTKNAIIEIRAGAGGDEAGIFAADLLRMYLRFAETKGWSSELINKHEGQPGAIKEVIFLIKGLNVYKHLKFESGVHRVQRIPVTESQGRVHTSTATVAVLPEADNVDIELKEEDIRIDVFRSSGPGGQSVNTTDSAVRITHLPTGIIVTCQDEKSQHKNKAKALNVLKSRLLAIEEEKRQKEESALRRSQIGKGDRSEKIRTYNYPQDRVTDHRIKQNWSDIPGIMDGNLDSIIEEIQTEYISSKLSQ
jgi:peptide chain release factor 1